MPSLDTVLRLLRSLKIGGLFRQVESEVWRTIENVRFACAKKVARAKISLLLKIMK